MRRVGLMACLAILVLALGGCTRQEDGGPSAAVLSGRIEGNALYRERMLLPPGALLEVQLQDISRPDAQATVLKSVRVELSGGPPYAFALDYDPGGINPRLRYALRATITFGDELMFTTTEYIDPFAGSPLEVILYRVAEQVSRHPG
jgi:putative lipoprotein